MERKSYPLTITIPADVYHMLQEQAVRESEALRRPISMSTLVRYACLFTFREGHRMREAFRIAKRAKW